MFNLLLLVDCLYLHISVANRGICVSAEIAQICGSVVPSSDHNKHHQLLDKHKRNVCHSSALVKDYIFVIVFCIY